MVRPVLGTSGIAPQDERGFLSGSPLPINQSTKGLRVLYSLELVDSNYLFISSRESSLPPPANSLFLVESATFSNKWNCVVSPIPYGKRRNFT